MRKIIKKLYIGLFLVFFMPISSLLPIGFGVFGGLNLGNSSIEQATTGLNIEPDFRPSYVVGGYVNFGFFVPFLSIQPEVRFTSKGYNLNLLQTVSVEVSSDYVEIPLLLQLKIPIPFVSLSAVVGPSFSFLTSRFSTVTSSDANVPSASENLTSDSNIFDVGLLFGGGISYEILIFFEIFVNVRYSYSFLDVTTSELASETNRNLYITGGVGFSL